MNGLVLMKWPAYCSNAYAATKVGVVIIGWPLRNIGSVNVAENTTSRVQGMNMSHVNTGNTY